MEYPKVFKYSSEKAWKNLLILWAIHWNEICWPKVLTELVTEIESNKIKIESWSVTIIPICNIEGHKQDVRFVEENLNRVFGKADESTYERALAAFIKPYIESSDYVLDLHSFQSEWKPFMFEDVDDEETKAFVKAVWCPNVVKWWTEMYPWEEELDTIGYTYKVWKKWALIECWSHREEGCFEVWTLAALNALKYLKIINWDVEEKPLNYLTLSKLVRKEKEWKMLKKYIEMESFNKGDIIAKYNDGEEIVAENNWNILFPNDSVPVWEEWFYLCYKK